MVNPRIQGCRSDEIAELAGDIEVRGWSGATTLKASPTEDRDQRRELIAAVRAGQHVELVVTALVYRQDGQPNRRGLRFAVEQLAAIAGSFVGKPFLVDHNTNEQAARMGTIMASGLVIDAQGALTFEMTFSVVKPDAVVSILDGTLDAFSIAWFPTGPVICTVHQVDIRGPGSCSCWPGDVITVDGRTAIVEYEFQSAEGKELSGVNVPAVKGTRIEEVRAALAAEIGIERPAAAATVSEPTPLEPVGPAIVEPLGSVIPTLPRSMAPARAWSLSARAKPTPLSPELRNAARLLGLTEDQIRQNMIEHGELSESGEAVAPDALTFDEALRNAARILGMPFEEIEANAIKYGELPEPRAAAAPQAPAYELALDEALEIAAEQLGLTIEELWANMIEHGERAGSGAR